MSFVVPARPSCVPEAERQRAWAFGLRPAGARRLGARCSGVPLGGCSDRHRGRAGTIWRTWAYNGQVPGPMIRATQGERIRVVLENQLAEPTTIHWHGVPLPNAMDGVPELTQEPVAPGGTLRLRVRRERAGHVLLPLARRASTRSRVARLAGDRSRPNRNGWRTASSCCCSTTGCRRHPDDAMAAMMATTPGMGGGMMGGGMMGGGMAGATSATEPPYAGLPGERPTGHDVGSAPGHPRRARARSESSTAARRRPIASGWSATGSR